MAKTVFSDGNASTGGLGTLIIADFLNALNNHRHTGRNIDGEGALDYAVTTGGSNAYVLTLPASLNAYVTGMPFYFKVSFTNTGAATMNINNLGAVSLKKNGSDDVVAGDLNPGQIYMGVYDGTYIQIANPSRYKTLASNGYGVYTASATMSSGDYGRCCHYLGSAGTLTLPEAVTGGMVAILNHPSSTGNLTIESSLIINAKGTSSTSLTLTPGQSIVLVTEGSAWWEFSSSLGNQLVQGVLEVGDYRTNGTAPDSITNGAWRTRTLNTVLRNSIDGASLVSSIITLPAGTYHFRGIFQFGSDTRVSMCLYDITTASIIALGVNESIDYGLGSHYVFEDFIMLTATSTFEFLNWVSASGAVAGYACSFGNSEIYANVIFEKIG